MVDNPHDVSQSSFSDAASSEALPGDDMAGDGWPGDGPPGDRWPGDAMVGDGWPGDGPPGDRLEDLADRLLAIAEEIADIALDRLRESVEAGATKPSAEDKRLARARRSATKAAHLLRVEPSGPD